MTEPTVTVKWLAALVALVKAGPMRLALKLGDLVLIGVAAMRADTGHPASGSSRSSARALSSSWKIGSVRSVMAWLSSAPRYANPCLLCQVYN